MAEDTEASAETSPKPTRRRRASRAAGPAGEAATGTVRADAPTAVKVRLPKSAGPPPRRQPNRKLVATVALATTFVVLAVLAGLTTLMYFQQRDTEAVQARQQRFVDTAKQSIVNMHSYTQDSIDASVDRFIDGTSGRLRAEMTAEDHADNLKLVLRETNASAEAVINGAAIEKVDEISNNAAVLVSVQVTMTDIDGNNQPSKFYRFRVIVHEDDAGHMTTADLMYPDGGN